MKKSFMFVAVAAAGMLASCSSESLTGSDPKIETPDQEELVAIQIGVATPQVDLSTKAGTRGAGTVGDLSSGTNIWKGEKVNVYMFEKGTLTLAEDGTGNKLYNNVELTTPKPGVAGIAAEGVASGVANELNPAGNRVTYKYYPVTGNFDFWGYYIDDAGNGDPAIGEKEVKVPFTIDGSQDLMVAKAEPSAAEIALLDAQRNTDYYSAYAARKTVQPNMTFKHLLTRLTFSVVGGNNEAIGFKDGGSGYALPDDGNTYEGVFIRSIRIRSLKSGNIIAAWIPDGSVTTGAPAELISFTKSNPAAAADSTWMELKSKDRNGETGKVTDLYDNSFVWATDATIQGKLVIGGADWDKIQRPKSLTEPVTVGGSLLVAPDDKYVAEIVLGQILVTEEDFPGGGTPTTKVVYSPLITEIIPTAPDVTFEQGKSYNVKMKLYGAQRIVITTTLQAWESGTEVEINAD